MPIWRNNALVRAVYRGTTPVLRVFARGGVEVWRASPVDDLRTSGTGSVVAPSYAAFAEFGVIGGGASGSTGDNGFSTARGKGAPPAVWQWVTVAVNPGDTFDFTIGTGGAQRTGIKISGQNGTATTVTKAGSTVVTSAGSVGPAGNTANNDPTGFGAAASSANGLALPGGADVGANTAGTPPGGGGGGGPSIPWTNPGTDAQYWSGAGGRGEMRFRWRSF